CSARRCDGARVGLARARANRRAAFGAALRRRQLLTLASVPLLVLVPLRVVVLRHAAPDHAPHRRRARLGLTARRPHVHAVLFGVLRRGRLPSTCLVSVPTVACSAAPRRGGGARVGEACPGTHRGAACGAALRRRQLLTLAVPLLVLVPLRVVVLRQAA